MLMNRCDFLKSAAALAVMGYGWNDGVAETEPPRGIRVRFLGSGASGWKTEWAKKMPHMRRQSSVLLENHVLIDYTWSAADMLPKGCRPEAIFVTHSHGDHYDPQATVKLGVKRMYVHETWATAARREMAAAAKKLGLPTPEVIAVRFGEPVLEGGLAFTSVPSNHATARVTDGVLERTSMYLVEKGESRLLYATDTGGIPGDAAWMIGIDSHITEKTYRRPFSDSPFVHRPQAITAFIMEATSGDLDDDFRLFIHSSVQTVSRIADMLKKTKRFLPPAGQPVYLTHIGLKYRSWPSERIDAELPEGIKAASDGLEVVLG